MSYHIKNTEDLLRLLYYSGISALFVSRSISSGDHPEMITVIKVPGKIIYLWIRDSISFFIHDTSSASHLQNLFRLHIQRMIKH